MPTQARVIYLMSGAAHLPYLVTSLRALREMAKFEGIVEVHAWPESYPFVKVIAEDDSLKIEAIPRVPRYRGKNAQFFDKLNLMQSLEGDYINLYLDADAMPVGPLGPLLNEGRRTGFCATQFNDWTLSSKMVRKRIERLREYLELDASVPRGLGLSMLNGLMNDPNPRLIPSVNGGVFCCRYDSAALHWWQSITDLVKENVFIADEAVLHLLIKGIQSESYTIKEGGQYNASPRFWKGNNADVVIWHFHGDSNVRPNKSQRGFDLWWPTYAQCLWDDTGRINAWIDAIKNKHLGRLEESIGRPTRHMPLSDGLFPGAVDG